MIAIADSSGLISLFIESDLNHTAAVKIKQSLNKKAGKLYIASEIFAEIVNILGKNLIMR